MCHLEIQTNETITFICLIYDIYYRYVMISNDNLINMTLLQYVKIINPIFSISNTISYNNKYQNHDAIKMHTERIIFLSC